MFNTIWTCLVALTLVVSLGAVNPGSSAESVGRIEVPERGVGGLRPVGGARGYKALAALGARLPRTVGPGRQPAARVLRCATVLRMTAATDRAGGPCGPAGRLALDRLTASATAEPRSVVAEDRRKQPRTWRARFRAAQAVADAQGFLFAWGLESRPTRRRRPHASDHGSRVCSPPSKARCSAPPPLRGADGLDAGSANARPGACLTMSSSRRPHRRGDDPVPNDRTRPSQQNASRSGIRDGTPKRRGRRTGCNSRVS